MGRGGRAKNVKIDHGIGFTGGGHRAKDRFADLKSGVMEKQRLVLEKSGGLPIGEGTKGDSSWNTKSDENGNSRIGERRGARRKDVIDS